jgi:hypothetical protein
LALIGTTVAQLPEAWDTVTFWPAIVSVAERAAPGLAATEIVVVPLPLPDAPLVIVTVGSVLVAVQEQTVPGSEADTVNVAGPPAAEIETGFGKTENEQPLTMMCIVPVKF